MINGQCILNPECEHGLHAASDHPCGKRPRPPGAPCGFCGKPLAADDSQPDISAPCPDCWRPATFLKKYKGW